MKKEQPKSNDVRYVPKSAFKLLMERIKRLLGIKKRGPYAR